MKVACNFHVRVPVGDQWRYDKLSIQGWHHDGNLHTEYPPIVGDLIHLHDDQHSGVFRVIERSWLHSSWGSTNWPYDKQEQTVDVWLDLIVEPAEGLFRNEAPLPPEDEE